MPLKKYSRQFLSFYFRFEISTKTWFKIHFTSRSGINIQKIHNESTNVARWLYMIPYINLTVIQCQIWHKLVLTINIPWIVGPGPLWFWYNICKCDSHMEWGNISVIVSGLKYSHFCNIAYYTNLVRRHLKSPRL